MSGQLENIRARLETERRCLADELESKLTQSTVETHGRGISGNVEEMATEALELESRLAGVRHVREQLAEVEHALNKLAKGTYGMCDLCGKPIAPARLEAVPQANLCLECKARQTKSARR